jgi:hypothetical protein
MAQARVGGVRVHSGNEGEKAAANSVDHIERCHDYPLELRIPRCED